MFFRVARLRRMAAATSERRLFITTMSAASMAMSVPAPMAMPMSARESAGASLMPSPTMAVFPAVCKARMAASFSAGRTWAMTSSTPAARPMAAAVRRLSPVSMTTRSPIALSWAMAATLSSRRVSATAIKPRETPSRAKKRGVLPSSARASAVSASAVGRTALPLTKARLPPQRRCPSMTAVSPWPGSA